MLTPDFTFWHTATLEPWLRRGISKEEYDIGYTVKCRVDLRRRHSVSGSSPTAVVYASGTAFLPAGTQIKEKDRFTFMNKTYTVSACQPCFDVRGDVNHIEVELM